MFLSYLVENFFGLFKAQDFSKAVPKPVLAKLYEELES
jgi:hypothetical protein